MNLSFHATGNLSVLFAWCGLIAGVAQFGCYF